MMKSLEIMLKREPVLMVSSFLALISMVLVPPSLSYIHYIDFKVLGCLFCLMLVVSGFQKIFLFNHIASFLLTFAHNPRQVSQVLIVLTFFSSMAITNDVALITFVPLTIVVFSLCRKTEPILPTIILQTVGANVGSSLTPVGNPQNLYLFSYYSIPAKTFFFTMLPLVFAGAMLLLLLSLSIPRTSKGFTVEIEKPAKMDVRQTIRYALLFLLSLGAVFNVLSWYSAVIIVVLFSEKILLKKVDYSLLLTFVALFIFVGNLGSLRYVQDFFRNLLEGRVFATSLIASQLISNVPATFLLSPFTGNSRQLLLGVNAGGCGTLIASMASVISFKYFINFAPNETKRYFYTFTGVNLLFVLLFTVIWILFLQ
ncbi:Na+/H+ antiporter NhaD-like permease [Sphaerochaeta pleomorpha str. Grapes]|uniref:Na+/H+ antiporter NhaD-like permease n=1 Tax=Sphaerochaeta pleomorpha (strain ATCC BAA-1885 / DSM 22778 / Grapes) TaxID=158190 RepID=G8QVL5_SPHPG|nr:SLC13 family permease [Sphaerochaeta pleomorpha]AEV28248.1 Na+/H+ antiporter NhaD-like permease [Sphaerochaeta pleomorpha str. Grapes]